MDQQTAITLAYLSGIPRPALIEAIRRLESGRAGVELGSAASAAAVLSELGLDTAFVSEVISPLARLAADALERASRHGIATVPWAESTYPALLSAIADPPLLLWTRGDTAALNGPAVAIVGSRAGSAHALQVAERLAGDLAERGFVIVSGLARGVDAAAHRGALATGGRTVAVLGCGADIYYPAEHRKLAAQICASGAIATEFAPGTPPRPWHFPARNRIISGLSLAVVVVEASEHSGSLITAGCALDQGREVMAVPGNVLSGRNRGAHALIRDGARIVESADDIVDQLRLPPAAPVPGVFDKQDRGRDDPVLRHMLEGEPYDLDTLVQLSGLTAEKILPRLLQLELDGLVARGGAGRFLRTMVR